MASMAIENSDGVAEKKLMSNDNKRFCGGGDVVTAMTNVSAFQKLRYDGRSAVTNNSLKIGNKFDVSKSAYTLLC